MKKLFLLPALLLSLTPISHADSCVELSGCAKVMHTLLGQDYVWTEQSGVKINSSIPMELTKENAEVLFTSLLDQSGFARQPVGDGKTFRIVRAATIKESETPIVEASADKPLSLPNTWDWVTMRYKVSSPELPSYLEQSYRYHVPRESRIQADMNSGTVNVTATIPIVRQMYQNFKSADKPLSKATKEDLKEWSKHSSRSNTEKKNEKD